MENSQCEPCKARDNNNKPTQWCVICEEALCLQCSEHHRVQKMSRHHELLDINIKPTHINISDQRCSKHENLSFEYFCVDHESLCCKECQVESHRSCQKIMSVDIASKGIKSSQSFIDAVELIEQVLKTTPTIIEDRHTLIESIETEANFIKDEIRNVKEETITHIEYLAKLLLEDLKLKKDKIVTNAKGQIDEFEDLKRMTKEKNDTFDIVEKHGSERQAFLAVHVHKTVLDELEERISAITEKTTYSSIKLNPNLLKKSITSIGTIEIKELPTATEFVKRKKRQSQIPIAQRQHLPSFIQKNAITGIPIAQRQHLPSFIQKNAITGIGDVEGLAVSDKDELCITSSVLMIKNKILVYDNNEKLKYEMNFSFYPGQIAIIPCQNKGIMRSSRLYLNNFRFVDFQAYKMLNEILIEGCQGGGIAASNENICIGAIGNMKVLDHNGRYIRSIKMNDKRTPRYIVLDKSGNIYHSDIEVVCCTRIDGVNLFTYKPPDNKRLYGVAVDSQGYVYVVVQYQGVCRLNPDGTFNDLVVVNEDLKQPFKDICFNKDCTKLYISYEEGVLVYTRQ